MNSIFPWLSFIIALLISILIFNLLKKRIINICFKIIFATSGFILSFVLIFIIVFLSYFFIFNCSDSEFWDAVTPAHELHAILKNYKQKNGIYPQTQDQLIKLSPDLFETIEEKAKQIYIYNSENDTYTWFVRPSHYYVAIFDSKSDYSIYRIPHFFVIPSHWANIANFPPKYEGPWDKIPK